MSLHGINTTTWTFSRATFAGHPSSAGKVTVAYIDVPPNGTTTPKATLLLIHGFPQTSHQFRHILNPLASAGYRIIAPDYRGAGQSSRPPSGYDKVTMASDLHKLLHSHLNVTGKVQVVGHDIGGMVAHAYAAKFPSDTASVTWGECPLPGGLTYEEFKHRPECWHFTFHNQLDLPELLVQGRERQYLMHFYTRLCRNHVFLSDADVDYYAGEYSTVGGLRAGFGVYRAFGRDTEDNVGMREKGGKLGVRCCLLNGEGSGWAGKWARRQGEAFYERVSVVDVEAAGHWLAEENPRGFVEGVVRFVEGE